MLIHHARGILLALASYNSLASGRAVPPCSGVACTLADSSISSVFNAHGDNAFHDFVLSKRSLDPTYFATWPRSVLPRIEPIIEPKPPAETEPNPEGPQVPGQTSPKDPPDTQPKDTCIEGPGENIKKRCSADTPTDHPPEDDNNVSEGEDPEADASSTQAPPGITDFFDLVKSSSAGPNRARDFLAQRFNDKVADEAIPDINQVNPNYKFDEPGAIEDEGNIIEDSAKLFRDEGVLQQAGIDIPAATDMNVEVPGRIFDIEAEVSEAEVPFFKNTYSLDGKLAFVNSVDKSFDNNPDNVRLPWFKMFMHILTNRVADGVAAKDLEAIGQLDIINTSTQKTIASIFAAMGSQSKGKWLKLSSDAPPGSDEASAFDAMTRTDNGKGTFWLLGTYRESFQDKIVTQIWIRRELIDTQDGENEGPQMLLVLGPRDA